MKKEINLFPQEVETASLLNQMESDRHCDSSIEPGIEHDAASDFQVKRIIEALLFVSNEPLPFTKIREILEVDYPLKPRSLRRLIEELQEEYIQQQRAFKIEEVAQGFILITLKDYSAYIDSLYRNRRHEKLSPAATEVLAIIAYRQPITKPQIEAIRGVDSSGTLQNLLERGLIEATGKLEAPGRPTLYGITKTFLTHFGLKDLSALPKFHEKI